MKNLLQKYAGYILIGLGIILLIFTLGCCPNSCQAQDVQYSTAQRWVTDNEDLFTPEQEKALSDICSNFEKQTTCEIAILTTDNLEGYGDISEYATFVGQKWGVGKDSLDNGLMIVISAKLRKAFAATGYGLEGYLPDITVNRLIDNAMPHHFKNKEYFDGTKEFLDGVTTTLGPNFQYSATENKEKINSNAETTESGFGIIWIIVIIALIIIVGVVLVVSGVFSSGGSGGYVGGYSGGGYDSSSSSSFSSGDSGSFGGGDFGGGGGGTDW